MVYVLWTGRQTVTGLTFNPTSHIVGLWEEVLVSRVVSKKLTDCSGKPLQDQQDIQSPHCMLL